MRHNINIYIVVYIQHMRGWMQTNKIEPLQQQHKHTQSQSQSQRETQAYPHTYTSRIKF